MNFYIKYRNIYNKLVKQAKANHYSKALRESSSNIKKTWDLLKEIIAKNRKKSSAPNTLNAIQNDSFIMQLENPKLIAEYFNSFFSSVGERTSLLIDTNNTAKDPLDYMKNISIDQSFFISPTNTCEVISVAMRIKSKSSTGFDNISNTLIKN